MDEKNHARNLQDVIGGPVPEEFDKAALIAEIGELKRKLPNGDVNRITEEQLAKWAGLENDHKLIYPRLNPHSHFDLNNTLQEFDFFTSTSEHRDSDQVTQALHLPIKTELLLVSLRICLYLMIGMREFGVSAITDAVEDIARKLTNSEIRWAKAKAVLGEFLSETRG